MKTLHLSRLNCCALTAGICLSGGAHLAGQTVYSNDFANLAGVDQSYAAAGYNWGYVRNGGPMGEASAFAQEGLTDQPVTFGPGGSANYMSFAAGPGFIFYNGTQAANQVPTLFYSNDMAAFAYTQITSVSFSIRNTTVTEAHSAWQVGLQIDGNWYVSDTGYRNASGASFETITIDPQVDTTWSMLDFEVGMTPLTLSASGGMLPGTGELQQVGMFLGGPWLDANAPNGQFRFSSIEVTAIPEPSTYALLFGLGALAIAVIRRRRKQG